MATETSRPKAARAPRVRSDWPFFVGLSVLGGSYVLLVVAMMVADASYSSLHDIFSALSSREIRFSIWLSLFTCSASALLSVLIAVPLGYLMSRFRFPAQALVDVIIDVPIVLPPLVIGLSLLILFQTAPGQWVEQWLQVTYAVPGVILAQFSVACAFAIRTMRVTFDQINPRTERVALTLGCSRAQAFWLVALPESRRGILTAGTLAWARSLGEFGPILVFAGATRMKTEVLSTSVFLELSTGNLQAAVAVSLLMIAAAGVVLFIVRFFGLETEFGRRHGG